MGVKYIALKRLRVGDGYREPGEEVPEAASWRNVTPYVNTGRLAVVAEEGSDGIDVARAGNAARVPLRAVRQTREDVFADAESEASSPVSSGDFDYHTLNVDEVKSALEDGLLTPEEVDAYESERKKGRRSGVDDALESYFEDEDGDDPEDEDDDETE